MAEQRSLEWWKEQLASTRIEVDGEEFHVAEGDLLMDDRELEEYAREHQLREEMDAIRMSRKSARRKLPGMNSTLIGFESEGRIVRWTEGKILTYAIDRRSFGTPRRYNQVRECLYMATRDWEETCGVRFQHLSDLDVSSPRPSELVTFVVSLKSASANVPATAFYPNSPVNRRWLFIFPFFFSNSMKYEPTGIMRHEIGHVLGFKHENVRPGAAVGCPGEPAFKIANLTDYDPQSVMHYFCGGVGTLDMKITEVDRMGAQRLYGPPASTFHRVT